MSYNDWALHKYILHDDDSPMVHWRKLHRLHHLEFDKITEKHGDGLGFTYVDMLLIAFVTGIPIALAVYAINKKYLTVVLLLHVVGTFIGVGIHNYSHRIFHEHTALPACMQVPVPESLYINLHKHHIHHHENTKTNYCTVFLGFDYMVGTNCNSLFC